MISLDGIIGGLIGWLLAQGIASTFKAIKNKHTSKAKAMQIKVTAPEVQLQGGLDPEQVVDQLNQLSCSSRKTFR